jgi:hypothetical protein
MRTRIVVLSVILLCGLASSYASAQTPPPTSNRPGATLLLPYFEVDLDNPEGTTTLFSVNNASATAVLGHVTLWSDMGIPVFAFDIYMTGYDVVPINMRDILNGTVPITASDGQDPFDGSGPNDPRAISNQGQFSQDINFASCNGRFPYPAVPAEYVTYMRAALTGQASSFHAGQCVARNHGTPSIARGYVTVDTVNACGSYFPSDIGIAIPTITSQNVLFGEYSYVTPGQDLAYGDHLVSIGGLIQGQDSYIAPGNYTFYGRFNGFTAMDAREPLSTTFAARFVAPKDFKTVEKARRRAVLPPATELVVWRDTKVANVNGFACGTTPAWYPLSQEDVVAFDEQENIESPTFPSAPFPGATQRVTVASSAFPLTTASGWLYLNLNTVVPGGGSGLTDPTAAQAWVTVLNRVQQGPNGGRYDVGFRAIRMDSARSASHVVLIP